MSKFKIASAEGKVTKREAQTYGRRLLKLADYLQSIPANQYQHSHWYKDGEGQLRNGHCGTSACALGWAAASGLFKKQGLTLRDSQFGDGKVPCTAGYYVSTFPRDASDFVFGPLAFEKIFNGDAFDKGVRDVTRTDAVRRIRSFVRQRYGWVLA